MIGKVNKREIPDDGLIAQRRNLLWAIVRQAFRDAKRGDIMAIEFCFAIALRPTKLSRELETVHYTLWLN